MPRKDRHQLTLPNGWTATYTLGRDPSGATVITRLSIEPADRDAIPAGGLTAKALRAIPMGTHTIARTWESVVEEFATWDDLAKSGLTWNELVREGRTVVSTATPPKRGRRHDESFLLIVAQAWDQALRSGDRDLYAKLVAELRRQGYSYTRSGARELVNKARDRDLLERTLKGRPGGGLTRRARELLADS